MNRLRALDGGQQLKANDWAFIQDATALTIKNLIEGLKGAGPCIVTGLDVDIDLDAMIISWKDGVIFDGDELCFVPGDATEYHADNNSRGPGDPLA
ncbi:MAG: hypothetical protein NTW16_04225, partial [Bacteroidetes bacterium]|nr:hypothetical protein [Bacteroidota bacterium]